MVRRSEVLKILKMRAHQVITPTDFAFARKYLEEDLKEVPEKLRREWIEAIISYFFQNLRELVNLREDLVEDEEVDERSYREVTKRIKRDIRDSDSEAKCFRKVTEIVVPYLIFIAKKPVHPPKIRFPGGLRIKESEGRYLCPAKGKQINPYSFCEFCPCEGDES